MPVPCQQDEYLLRVGVVVQRESLRSVSGMRHNLRGLENSIGQALDHRPAWKLGGVKNRVRVRQDGFVWV